MKETIIKKLKEVVGLSEEQATKAADVIMDIVSGKDGEGGIASKLGDMAGGLGGMFGGDKEEG